MRSGSAIAVAALALACMPLRPSDGFLRAPERATLAYHVVPAAAPGNTTTIIVLHGGPGATHEYMRPEWDRLAATGRLIFYDQRGCGESTRRGPYSWQGHLRDLDAVVEHFAPHRGRVVLASSSWGSWLALLYAHAHPDRVRGLVLSGTVPWPGIGRLLRTAADSLEAGLGASRVLATDTLPPIHVPLSVPGRFFAACEGVTITRAAQESMPRIDSLSNIRVPVLLLAGANPQGNRDGTVALGSVLPGAQRIVIAGAGHDPWLEQTGPFFDAAIAFIRSLKPER